MPRGVAFYVQIAETCHSRSFPTFCNSIFWPASESDRQGSDKFYEPPLSVLEHSCLGLNVASIECIIRSQERMAPTSKTALLLLGCSATAEAFIAPSLPTPALRRSAALSATDSSLKMVSTGKKSWQEIAEKLGNPFVPPQDKPALLQELLEAERREEIRESVTKVGPFIARYSTANG